MSVKGRFTNPGDIKLLLMIELTLAEWGKIAEIIRGATPYYTPLANIASKANQAIREAERIIVPKEEAD